MRSPSLLRLARLSSQAQGHHHFSPYFSPFPSPDPSVYLSPSPSSSPDPNVYPSPSPCPSSSFSSFSSLSSPSLVNKGALLDGGIGLVGIGAVHASHRASQEPIATNGAGLRAFSASGVAPFGLASTCHSWGSFLLMDAADGSNGDAPPLETRSEAQRFKIYTKTGDAGTSSLYNGTRRTKDDRVFRTLGDVDELNSHLGMAYELCLQIELADTCTQLQEIQSRLLDVGSAVATPLDTSSRAKLDRVRFPADAVGRLEVWIDEMDATLPPLKNFILPSGGVASAQLHIARSVCRRAERSVVALVTQDLVEAVVLQYLNRLSDYLFVAARHAASKCGRPETIYQKSHPESK